MKEKIILIQTAMEVECKEIINNMSNITTTIIQGYKYYEGTFQGRKVVISLSKVGLIHAS